MLELSKNANRILLLFFALFVTILSTHYAMRNFNFSADDSFITFRYAYHFQEGLGLSFNVGEKYYGTTAAGYAVILAILYKLFSFGPSFLRSLTLQNISVILSSLSLGSVALGLPLVTDVKPQLKTWILSVVFATLLLSGYCFNDVPGHETYAFMALLFWAVVSAHFQRPIWLGLLLLLAISVRPDSVLMVPIIVLLSGVRHEKGLKAYVTSKNFLTPFLIILFGGLLWMLFLYTQFGQILPGTLVAKKAQKILSEYFPTYNLKAVGKYMLGSFRLRFIVVLFVLALLPVFQLFKVRMKSLASTSVFVSAAFLLFGTGLFTVYKLLKVSFWFWYVSPIIFSVVVAAACGSFLLVDRYLEGKKTLALASSIMLAGVIVAFQREAIQSWWSSPHVNEHTSAYTEIAAYLKQIEPQGTSIQMPEPGAFGMDLGPKYRVVDELGLITPGVAQALLKRDFEYTRRAYHAKYLICSWVGKYSACGRETLDQYYELIGEFNKDFWVKNIGRGARLFKLKENVE